MEQGQYKTPAAFQAAVKTKAKALATAQGLDVADLMLAFYFSRLAARVFHTDPDGWMVKGGQALLLRYSTAARLSQDIDIQRVTPGDVREALEALLAAAAVELDDYLRFVPGKRADHSDRAKGAKQAFTVYMGTRRVATVRVDIVVGRTLTGTPETRPLTTALDLAWPTTWPDATIYPVVDHVADKVCAMYEVHDTGPSSRHRDLADLLLISQRETIDGGIAHRALRVEAERRRHLGTDLRLPPDFRAPDPSWPANYPAAARKVAGLADCATWAKAEAAAERFLSPLLAPSPPGWWDPAHSTWNGIVNAAPAQLLNERA